MFEKNGNRLASSTNVRRYVAFVFKQETERIKNELSARKSRDDKRRVWVIFNESTRQREAIIVRFIDDG